MSPRRRWLDGVARVLEADTGDLRALAEIGGADPRTLYIGTNLDGVDVRGQDLRGMALPGLNLDRARSDAATQLDKPETLFRLQQPLMLVVDDQLDPRSSLARDLDAAVFGADSVDEFMDSVIGGDGPALILVTPATRGLAAEAAARLRAVDCAFVCIFVETSRRSLSPKRSHEAAMELRPVITVQRQSGVFGSSGSALGEVRDLLRLLVADWGGRDRFLRGGATRFTRASGVGQDPVVDAAAQMFDRLWQLRASVRDTTLIIRGARGHASEFDPRLILSRLLDVMDTVEWPRPPKARGFDLAVFAPSTFVAPSSDDGYQAVVTALVERGWNVEWNGLRTDRFDFQMSAGGPVFTGRMSREAGRLTIKPSAWPPLDAFRITEVDTLVVTPDADIGTVAERMLIDREFWVTSRDLLAFPTSAPSLWLLIAGQMRRMGRSIEGRGRQLYLRLLLSAALEARTVFDPALKLVDGLIRDPRIFEHLKVTMSRYVSTAEGARCLLKVTERSGFGEPRRVGEIAIVVDHLGIWVTSPDQAGGQRPGLLDGGITTGFRTGLSSSKW